MRFRPSRKYCLQLSRKLAQTYPQAKCELIFGSSLQLLVAVILSAQCTDKRVNMVTPALFCKYPDVESFAHASQEELEKKIRSAGFYRNKARNIRRCCQAIVERFGGQVPATMEELLTLDGVGRKTANVILGNIYETPGLVVDTHMIRLSNRLALTDKQDPHKIEIELCNLIPQPEWTLFSHLIIWHGRRTCYARKPNCPACLINTLCPSRQDLTKIQVGLKSGLPKK